jgi:DNA-binding HxlR family transcriptional regulator
MTAVAQRASKAGKRNTGTRSARPHVSTRPLAQIEPRERFRRLALLFHRRWNVPMLAELLRGDTGAGGAKFITLANRLKKLNHGREISRDSLKATLDYLIEHDYVMRNPGYGHPMRPEYLLAEAGYDTAPHCQSLLNKLQNQRNLELARRKWDLPTIAGLGLGFSRFSELKAILPKITSRALTLTLKQLTNDGFVDREIMQGYPPSTRYRLNATARDLLPILAKL